MMAHHLVDEFALSEISIIIEYEPKRTNSQQADLRPAQSSNVVVINGIVGKYEKILALKKLDSRNVQTWSRRPRKRSKLISPI